MSDENLENEYINTFGIANIVQLEQKRLYVSSIRATDRQGRSEGIYLIFV